MSTAEEAARWRANNLDRARQLARDAYHRRRAVIDSIKSVPCADCGIQYPPYVMDLDHTDPKQKVSTVSKFIASGNIKAALNEAKKCEVVCANCHRIRTYEKEQYANRMG